MKTSKQERRARLQAMQGLDPVFAYVDTFKNEKHASKGKDTPPKRFAKGDDIDAPAERWAKPRINTEKRTDLILNTRQSYHGGSHRVIQVDGKGPTRTP